MGGFTFQANDLGMLISVALMALGGRLLVIARRNRSAPELLIGLYLMLSPPATSLMMRVPRFDPALQADLQLLAFLLMALSALSLAGFAWRVFRPGALWAKCLTGLAALYFLGMTGLMALDVRALDVETRSLASRIALLLIYVWVFVECHLHRRMLVRRLRLGLADPVVVNRFLLFEIWSGVLAVLPGVILLLAAAFDSTKSESYGSFFAVVVRITGFAIYAAMWLSFLPPKGYRHWIQRRHADRSAGQGEVARGLGA